MSRWKWILVTILFFPQILSAYCCVPSPWAAAGWWGHFDYLLLWRSERHLPPLVSTGVLGDGGRLLFGDQFVGASPHSGFRFDGGIWCSDCLAFAGGVIIGGREKVTYYQNTDREPNLARPFIDAITGLPAAFVLLPFGEVNVDATNEVAVIEGYIRTPLLGGEWWNLDGVAGALFLNLEDNLVVSSRGTGFITHIEDHFDCSNNFYAGMAGVIGEMLFGCWRINVWGQFAVGNMVKETTISGNRRSVFGVNTTQGLLALTSNTGRHVNFQCEVVTLGGVDVSMKVWQGVHLSVGYLFMGIPRVALSGDQVDLRLDLTQTIAQPQYHLHDKSFWVQGFTAGVSVFY